MAEAAGRSSTLALAVFGAAIPPVFFAIGGWLGSGASDALVPDTTIGFVLGVPLMLALWLVAGTQSFRQAHHARTAVAKTASVAQTSQQASKK